MSAIINDGGPAFPVPTPDSTDGRAYDGGLTLRDYFAGQALAALISLPSAQGTDAKFANAAYGYADAMIAARKASQ